MPTCPHQWSNITHVCPAVAPGAAQVLDMLPDGGAGGAYDTPGGVAAFFGDPGRRDSIARVVESLLS